MADTASHSGDPLGMFRPLELDFVPDPEHEAWMQAEIRRTLKEKAEGRMSYCSLAEVALRFGANAR